MGKMFDDSKTRIDCFAYRGGKNTQEYCAALDALYCKNEKCPFYKTKKEYQEGIEKSIVVI